MTCEWMVIHRLYNSKPKTRRERCGEPAGPKVLKAYHGTQRFWLCKRHWHIMAGRGSSVRPLYLNADFVPIPFDTLME